LINQGVGMATPINRVFAHYIARIISPRMGAANFRKTRLVAVEKPLVE